MKQARLFCAILGIVFMASCCHKQLCVGDGIREVRFYGFDFHDLDTVRFEAYGPTGVDSLSLYQWVNDQKDEGTYARIDFSYNNELEPDENKAYRITIPKTAQVFEITDLHYKDDHCKSGMCRQDYRSLEFYSVNGELQFLQNHALSLTH